MDKIKRLKEPCLICGTKNKLTKHHLKSGKEIPLCRHCHDEVEEAKVYINSMKSRKAAFKRGEEKERIKHQRSIREEDLAVIIGNWYLKWKRINGGEKIHKLGIAKEDLKIMVDGHLTAKKNHGEKW